MDDDGEQRDLTFDDLQAYTRWPYTDGQLFLAMMTAVVKFSPRYAKVVIRTKRLYMLDEDLEIVDLTTELARLQHVHTVLNAAEETQARLRRARCALSHCRRLAPCQCTPRSCTLRASHIDPRQSHFRKIL
jgi:hypothetical protein